MNELTTAAIDLLKDLNQDCNFTENIKESEHVQGNNIQHTQQCNSAVTTLFYIYIPCYLIYWILILICCGLGY